MLKIKPIVAKERAHQTFDLHRFSLRYQVTLFWWFTFTTPPVYFFGAELTAEEQPVYEELKHADRR